MNFDARFLNPVFVYRKIRMHKRILDRVFSIVPSFTFSISISVTIDAGY